jgi:hypothetical protein
MAIGQAKDLKGISSSSTFEEIRYKLKKSRLERQYRSILMNVYPNIHEGFFDDDLFLIVEKE